MTEQEELRQLAEELFNETMGYFRETKFKLALETGLRAKDIYVQLKNRYAEAYITGFLAIVYAEMGNTALELQFALDALDVALDNDLYDIAARQYNNLGSKLIGFKSYDRALVYFQNAVEMGKKAVEKKIFAESDRNEFEVVVHMNLAVVYCHLGEFDKAKEHYALSKEMISYSTYEDTLFSYEVFEGLFFERIGEHEKADQFIDSIMKGVEKNTYNADYLEVFMDVIELFERKGDFERWEKVLRQMDAHLDDEASIQFRIEVLKQWLNFYKASGKNEEYNSACVKYYELAMEKDKQDSEREADAIELSAEMRMAMRDKKVADSLINQDPLTGVGNRNKMLSDSKILIEESIKNRSFIAVGLLDIDFFKESNDTYGHLEGDKCLKTVAHIIEESVGDEGFVYRYGGDEFLVLIKTGDVDLLKNVGKTIQDKLEKAQLPNERSPICPCVTISQGYTKAIAEEGDTIETLIKYADRVLYSVKRKGRNAYKYMTLSEISADM